MIKMTSRSVVCVVFTVLLTASIVTAQHCHKDEGCDDKEDVENTEALRLILVGKTGAGKSATGNTILGQKKFKVSRMSTSETKKSQLERTVINGRTVEVVDTPNVFENRATHQYISRQLLGWLENLARENHVFLYVLEARALGELDFLPYRRMQALLGRVSSRTVVVFTHADQLQDEDESQDSFLANNHPQLTALLQECGQRYVFVDNRSQDRDQVDRLLTKVKGIPVGHLTLEESPVFLKLESAVKDLLREVDAEEESHFSELSEHSSDSDFWSWFSF